MQITEVKVFPIDEEKLKAFVSVVFDGCFMVNDIKVIQGREGLFISMPSRKKKNGEFKDVAHPLNNQTRQQLEAAILEEYERALAERGAQAMPHASARAAAQPAAPPAAAGGRELRSSARRLEPATPPRGHPSEAPGPRDAGWSRTAESRPVVPISSAQRSALEGEEEEADRTLKEVEEAHLRDSFWSMG